MIKYLSIFRLVLRCLLVARKESLTGFSTGLTSRSKNLDPTGNLTGRSTRPVSISKPNAMKILGEDQKKGLHPHAARFSVQIFCPNSKGRVHDSILIKLVMTRG